MNCHSVKDHYLYLVQSVKDSRPRILHSVKDHYLNLVQSAMGRCWSVGALEGGCSQTIVQSFWKVKVLD